MHSATASPPTQRLAATEKPGTRIAVAIRVPANSWVTRLLPENNWLAPRLLESPLNLKLALEGILLNPFRLAGEMNNCAGIAEVSDRCRAIRIICETLCQLQIQWLVRVAWWDRAEGYWREVNVCTGEPNFDVTVNAFLKDLPSLRVSLDKITALSQSVFAAKERRSP